MTATSVSQVELDRIKAALIRAGELILLESVASQFAMPWQIINLLRRLPLIASRIQHLVAAVEVTGQAFFEAEHRVAALFVERSATVPEGLAALAAPAVVLWQNQAPNLHRTVGAELVAAPISVGQLAGRLAAVAALERPSIRVEKYLESGGTRFVVYLPGVKRLIGGPLDLRSGVIELGGQRSVVERAAEQALQAAGAGPGDRVTAVGHSLGGMAARSLAERSANGSIPFCVDKVVEFGSPVGLHRPISGLAVLSVENRGDFVPQLDGVAPADTGASRLVTQPSGNPNPLISHSIRSYSSWANSPRGSQTLGSANDFGAVSAEPGVVSYFEFGG